MGRPKGGNNRYWSKEEKLRIVKMVVDEHKTALDISKQENISNGMLSTWVKRYIKDGTQALENKKKPGSPYKGLHLKKDLTDLEQLQYENMKLRVENERLKKGYIVEGDGQSVIYDMSKFKNMK